MAGITVSRIAAATKEAAAGVDYSSRFGAVCPWCGKRTKVQTTKPWEDDMRIRYHRCENGKCSLAVMGTNIKSLEVDLA